MKRLLIIAAGFILQAGCNLLMAQTGGLEGVIVEKYYVSSASDTILADSNAYLPPGSVTYRIYADLKPVYRIQAVFGIEQHELRIQTSTRFYNCKSSDGRAANDIQPANLTKTMGMLDSWVSMGAAALDYQGVMKTEDDTSANLVMQHVHGILRNNDPAAGIPLSERDGMRFLRYQPATQFYHFDNDLHVFEYAWNDSVTGLLRTTDGAWASYGGAVGPQPDNRVLIAQFTTDGVLSFELNIQIATPDGGIEKYVARNPDSEMQTLPSLIYSSDPGNASPMASLTCSAEARSKKQAVEIVKLKADLHDKAEMIIAVELYVDGKPVARKTTAPFDFQWKRDRNPHTLYLKATDKSGSKVCSNNLYLEPAAPAQ